ncbi:MAG TPA: helix-turn-helix domain-containing protein [Acetobacteraceae bacterium]|jgi:AraC-like DNA-binding protein|nr:helix-turn-helix domain-containing protein [Acetobacteraceae bacterium]
MPGSSTGSFTDAADYQESLVDLISEIVVTQAGAFHARVTRASLRKLQILRAQETTSRVAFFTFSPQSVFVSFAADFVRPLIWRGVALQPGEVMLHGRGERLHQRIVGGGGWGLISLSAESFAGFGKALTGVPLTVPRRGQVLRPQAADRANLLRLHAAAARLAETNPQMLERPEVVRAMRQELAEALVTCLSGADVRNGSATHERAADVMNKFEALLLSRPGMHWRMTEISAALGVSDRTFRVCCAAFLGVSPHRYVHLRRLQLVRAAILRADPMTTRIADLAAEGGFTDLGRFAARYRAAYGEAPSMTLRRSAVA